MPANMPERKWWRLLTLFNQVWPHSIKSCSYSSA